MSDILPREDPTTSGRVTKLDVPLSRFLSESFHAGQDESMYHAIANTIEDQINKSFTGSKMLQPDEANQKYAIGNLKFTEPVNSEVARTMNERERQKMDRDMYLYSGAGHGRWLPGVAASILGSMANPLDFGSMFVPFVGEAGKVPAATRIGRVLQRGLIPMKAFDEVPVPKLVSGMVQGSAWAAMADMPKILQSHVEDQPMPAIGADMVGQAAFAGALHGIGEGLKFISGKTHEMMSRQAMNDFMEDKTISAHQYLPMDEHIIQFQSIEHQRLLRQEAANSVTIEAIKRDVVKEFGEWPIDPTLYNKDTGEKRTGAYHASIEGYEHSFDPDRGETHTSEKPWEQGFVTDKGRFVSRKEADEMTGSGGDFLTAEALHADTSDPDWLSHVERTHFDDLKEMGMTDNEALNKIREMREERRQRRILANPEVQKEIENRRQAAIDQWIENKKREDANPVPKEVREAAAEKTVSDEHVQKYNGDQGHMIKSLEDDIHGLGGKLPEEEHADRERDAFEHFLDSAIEKLQSDPTKLHIDPLLIKTLGAPVLRTVLMAIREAYSESKDLMQAIRQAFAEHKIENPEAEEFIKASASMKSFHEIAEKFGLFPKRKIEDAKTAEERTLTNSGGTTVTFPDTSQYGQAEKNLGKDESGFQEKLDVIRWPNGSHHWGWTHREFHEAGKTMEGEEIQKGWYIHNTLIEPNDPRLHKWLINDELQQRVFSALTQHLDPDKPFEVFTPKQAQVKIPESIDAAVNCILEKLA